MVKEEREGEKNIERRMEVSDTFFNNIPTYILRSLYDELIHFIELYESPIDPDDEEMMIWVLEINLALKSKDKTTVKTKKGPCG